MIKKIFFAILVAASLTAEPFAQAQTDFPRIGYLGGSLAANAARIEALRHGLRELGYSEGKNILIDWRDSEGKLDRLPAIAAEFVRLKVAIIITGGPASTRAAKNATNTIPVIMAQDSDPVGNGFIVSLARPGGNITGLATLAPELSGKRLELLKEISPKVSRVAVIGSATEPGNAQALKETELAARALALKLQSFDVREPKDVEAIFQAVSKGRADAILVLGGPVINSHRTQIIEIAIKRRLPAMYYAAEWVDGGGLATYSVSYTDLFHRAATYVDKILKGAKPADLPVEQPKKFEFIVNLKAAKRIGLTIPPNVLARADRVIR